MARDECPGGESRFRTAKENRGALRAGRARLKRRVQP